MEPTFALLSTITHVMLQGVKLQNASKVFEVVGPAISSVALVGNSATCKVAKAVKLRARIATATPMPSTNFL
jgi:hypothetical protein